MTDMTLLKNSAVFFQAHEWGEAIFARFERLWREVSAQYDCYVLLQNDNGTVRNSWEQAIERIAAQSALQLFNPDDLPQQLGYDYFSRSKEVPVRSLGPTRSLVPGSTCFPLIHLARSKKYSHYWTIESDVEYSGNWLNFLSSFASTNADLLVSHLRHYKWYTQIRHWPFWKAIHIPENFARINSKDLRKGFFPVYRISLQGLELFDKQLQQGWIGHYEVLLPTLLHLNNMLIQDLNDVVTSYVGDYQDPSKNRKRLSTMRWRPHISLDEFKSRNTTPLLFHPVKQDWYFDGNKEIITFHV